jgi:hypothetical protein
MVDTIKTTKVEIRLADGTNIKGCLNIHRYNRVSDCLNSKDSDQFLTIHDACMEDAKGKFVIINRNHIVWAVPEE